MRLELRESTVGACHVMWPRGGGGLGVVTPWEERSQPPSTEHPRPSCPHPWSEVCEACRTQSSRGVGVGEGVPDPQTLMREAGTRCRLGSCRMFSL